MGLAMYDLLLKNDGFHTVVVGHLVLVDDVMDVLDFLLIPVLVTLFK